MIFQPHLFSRTRDLAQGFAESLDLADEVILLPIYPARELPMPGVSSEMILSRMHQTPAADHQVPARIMSKDELLSWASSVAPASTTSTGGGSEPRLIIMAGAGDIDALVHPVAEKLKENR